MPIAVTDDQVALADAVRSWAARSRPVTVARAGEDDADAWRTVWPGLDQLGLFAIAAPGRALTDLAVALEAAATALVPGPLLTTALAGALLAPADDRPVGLALAAPELRRAGDGRLHGVVPLALGVTPDGWLLTPDATGTWCRIDLAAPGAKVVELSAADFSNPLGEVRIDGAAAEALPTLTSDRVRDVTATLAAAEASGVASWCLRTAADYAKVREQFGQPIGRFQAVKHLCADLLVRAEVAAAVAWDAAEAAGATGAAGAAGAEQHPLAAAVAATLALDAAVDNAKDCIQVLGGIGYTWEHDAHLYLRRALALRQFLGGTARWRARVSELTAAGARRVLHVDLDAEAERPAVRARAEAIAATPARDRRRALAESGYLVPHWPAPYGLDAPPARQLLVDEELARAGVVRPDLVIAGWALPTILAHGTPAQVERFVGPTLRGELTWCQLFSEPGAGSDLAGLRTRAVRTDGGWRLTGQKVWTSMAREADWAICLARTNPDVPKHKGITYFLVDMRAAGLDIRPLREITGEALFNEVFLDDVFVPDEQVVGEVDGGWALARATLAQERVAMGGGSSIGDAVERLVAGCVADGRAGDPVVAQRLGGLIADGLAGSLLDLRSTRRRLRGQDDGAAASVRKLIGVRHRQDVAEAAFELAGADGLVAGQPLHDLLLTRCLSIAGGTTQVLRTLAAERILGLPRG